MNTFSFRLAIIYLFIDAALSSNIRCHAQNLPDWENPDISGINKEMPHAYSFLASEKENNPTVQSLNGIWKFKWSPDPQSRPGNRSYQYGFILEYTN
jgi:beta-galactosidase